MRLIGVVLGCGLAVLGSAQVWQRWIAPGVTYRMEWQPAVPRTIHAFRLTPGGPSRLVPELAGGQVYGDGSLKGRETLSQLGMRTQALLAVNGDYFPFTGDPLGFMVRDRWMLSEPYPGRCALAWGPGGCQVIFPKTTLQAELPPGRQIALDGLDRECGGGQMMLFTPAAGSAIAKTPSLTAVLSVKNDKLRPTDALTAEVVALEWDVVESPIPGGTMRLVASGGRMTDLEGLVVGDTLRLVTSTTGFDPLRQIHAIGGGPLLLRQGKVTIDALTQGFNAGFSDRRHPRTAVGVTARGEVWLVAVDGRQMGSAGATLLELAELLRDLGCVDAMNLDGGGSTAVALAGQVINRPSEGVERAVANALTIVSDQAPFLDSLPVLKVPDVVVAGQRFEAAAAYADGEPIPNTDVVWWCWGSVWVDQGGSCRVLGDGLGGVGALIGGRPVFQTYNVAPKSNTTIKANR